MRFSGRVAGAMVAVLGFAGGLTGCKVETSREGRPAAEGGGETTTYRVAPMNRDEVKEVTNQAIEGTAEAAHKVKDAAVSAGRDAEVAAEAIRARHAAEGRGGAAPVAVPAEESAPVPR